MNGWTRRGAVGGGLALLPALASAARPTADIPIRLAGNIPWTPVWVNQKGPFPFRVRSDANTFVVSEAFGREIGLELQTAEWGLIGAAQHRRLIRFYRAEQMVIGGQVPMANVRLAIVDPIEARRDDNDPGPQSRFVGSIPVPSDRITAFQWAQGQMRLSPDLPSDVATYGKVPLRHFDSDRFGWVATVECRFAGKPVRLTVSTASPHAITFGPDAVKRLGLWDMPGPFYDRRTRYIGDEVEMRVRRAAGDLELGGIRIPAPVIGLLDPRKVLADVGPSDGAIGMDILRRFDVIFDPRRDTGWLRPVEPADAPWRYDRAGFEMEPTAGGAKVVRIDPGSPAEAAGLEVGDAIGLNAENIEKLEAAQTMAAGTKIEIPVLRDGVRQRVSVVNAERL